MLLERNRSCLILIDVQKKLIPKVQNSNSVVNRCEWLMRLARDLELPLLVTEQYPEGLDRTVDPLASLFSEQQSVSKVQFSCFPALKSHLHEVDKEQLVLIGIETHVCVLQSALKLKQAGYEVFVVVDAVSSRFEMDHKYALKRMKQSGIHLVTAEMVFFEWVGQAGTPEFKRLSQAYLK